METTFEVLAEGKRYFYGLRLRATARQDDAFAEAQTICDIESM